MSSVDVSSAFEAPEVDPLLATPRNVRTYSHTRLKSLRLPATRRTGQTVKVIYALAVALTYPLQLWPVIEIVWNKYALQHWVAAEGEWLWLWETIFRVSLVLLTCESLLQSHVLETDEVSSKESIMCQRCPA